ncbi:TetR/AcrR family transcriptional regulator, partial [Pseudomonas aeruginosa]
SGSDAAPARTGSGPAGRCGCPVSAAGCSKQTVYHHFGNKENLFIEVLEYTWNDIRQKEKALDFSDLPPQKAIEKIIDFTWDYYISNPWFLKI